MNKYELETLMGIKVLRRLCEVKVSAWVRRNTDKALCVCVSRMVEWNPCQCLESLSSLLSWINGKVTVCTGAHTHTHRPIHTRISFALSFHNDRDTVTPHSALSWRHTDTLGCLSLDSQTHNSLSCHTVSKTFSLFNQLSRNVWFRWLVLKHAET